MGACQPRPHTHSHSMTATFRIGYSGSRSWLHQRRTMQMVRVLGRRNGDVLTELLKQVWSLNFLRAECVLLYVSSRTRFFFSDMPLLFVGMLRYRRMMLESNNSSLTEGRKRPSDELYVRDFYALCGYHALIGASLRIYVRFFC